MNVQAALLLPSGATAGPIGPFADAPDIKVFATLLDVRTGASAPPMAPAPHPAGMAPRAPSPEGAAAMVATLDRSAVLLPLPSDRLPIVDKGCADPSDPARASVISAPPEQPSPVAADLLRKLLPAAERRCASSGYCKTGTTAPDDPAASGPENPDGPPNASTESAPMSTVMPIPVPIATRAPISVSRSEPAVDSSGPVATGSLCAATAPPARDVLSITHRQPHVSATEPSRAVVPGEAPAPRTASGDVRPDNANVIVAAATLRSRPVVPGSLPLTLPTTGSPARAQPSIAITVKPSIPDGAPWVGAMRAAIDAVIGSALPSPDRRLTPDSPTADSGEIAGHSPATADPIEDRPATLRPLATEPATAASPVSIELRPSVLPILPAAASTSAAPAVVERHLDLVRGDAWLDDLARDIAGAAVHGRQLKFALLPETLGRLDVEVRHGETGVSIHMAAQSEVARDALATAQPRLIDNITAQGVRVAGTEIASDTSRFTGQGSGGGARQPPLPWSFEVARPAASGDAAEPRKPGTDGRYA